MAHTQVRQRVCHWSTASSISDCSRHHTAAQCAWSAASHKTISGPEVLFKTCVAMKFVDDDDGDEANQGPDF